MNTMAILLKTIILNGQPVDSINHNDQYVMMEDVKKKKKKGKKIGGSKGKKSKKGFFSKVFGSK